MPISLVAQQETINQILGVAGMQMRIPQYQRPYSWTNEQIDELWSDVSEPEGDQHFMGPIVINTEDPSSPEVIDGQQRLTTITILQALIRDRLVELEGNAGLPEQVLLDHAAEGDDRYRMRSGSQNWAVLRDFVLRNPNDEHRKSFKDDVTSLSGDEKTWNRQLIRNVTRLSGYLGKYVEGLPNDQAVTKLEALSRFMTMKLIFVSIKVNNLANAFLLFETLNDRGLQLSAADLLKSHLLQQIAQSSLSVDTAAQRWDAMIESIQGADPATFLRHYLLLENEKVRKDQIYDKFKKTLKTTSASDVITRLETYADAYGTLIDPALALNPSTRHALSDIDGMGVKSALVPMMSAYVAFGHDQSRIVSFARVVESLAFRWTVCGLNAQQLESIFSSAARRVERSAAGELEAALSNLMGEMPDDETFKTRFMQLRPTMKVARYVLRRYAGQAMPGNVIDLYGGTFVHVEHVMPKTPTDFWISRGGGPDEYRSTVDLLGNLTLLAAKLNTAIQNSNFPTKKRAYQEIGNLPMTEAIAARPDWTLDDIVSRHTEIADAAPTLWPST